MNNSNEPSFDILQLASGHYLTTTIPDNWLDLSEEAQNQFILDNTWQPFESYDANFIWSHIEAAATSTQNFIRDREASTQHQDKT
jgi:hypothetical protein